MDVLGLLFLVLHDLQRIVLALLAFGWCLAPADADHSVADDLVAEAVSGLELIYDDLVGPVPVLVGHSLVQVRVEAVPERLKALDAQPPLYLVELPSH